VVGGAGDTAVECRCSGCGLFRCRGAVVLSLAQRLLTDQQTVALEGILFGFATASCFKCRLLCAVCVSAGKAAAC
jgi:hypothetical protein